MKYVFFIAFLLLGVLYAGAQTPCSDCDCLIRQAQEMMDRGDYKNALLKWQSARICAQDKSAWIDAQIQLLFEKALQRREYAQFQAQKAEENLAKSRENQIKYYEAEALKEFNNDNGRLAWLLTRETLKLDPENERALRLSRKLPFHLAALYLENVPLDDFDDNLAWSPDDRWLAILSDKFEEPVIVNGRTRIRESYSLHVFDLANRRKVFQTKEVNKDQFYFSTQSKFLVFQKINADLSSELNVMALETQDILLQENDIYQFVIHPDDTYWTYLSGKDSGNKFLHLYSADQDEEKLQLPVAGADQMQLSKDSRFLFFVEHTKDKKRKLNLWDQHTRNLVFSSPEFEGQETFWIHPDWKGIAYLLPAPDSAYTFHLWNVETQEEQLGIEGLTNSAEVVRDFSVLLTNRQTAEGKGNLVAFDLKNGEPIFELPEGTLYRRELSDDHRYLACFLEGEQYEGTFHLYDLANGEQLITLDSIFTYYISYCKENRRMGIWGPEGLNKHHLYIINLEEGASIEFDTTVTWSWKLSPDCDVLAYFQDVANKELRGTMILKNLDTGKTLLQETGVNSNRGTYYFSETLPCLTYATSGWTMHWWDYKGKKKLKKSEGVGRLIGRRAGTFFYSNASRHGDDQIVDLHVWNLKQYGKGFTINRALLKRGDLFPFYLARNDLKYFGATNVDRDLLVYEMDAGKKRIYPNMIPVEEAQFSPAYNWVAVLCSNGLVKLLSLKEGPDKVEPEFEFSHSEKEYYGIE